jgi:hypothetical protein
MSTHAMVFLPTPLKRVSSALIASSSSFLQRPGQPCSKHHVADLKPGRCRVEKALRTHMQHMLDACTCIVWTGCRPDVFQGTLSLLVQQGVQYHLPTVVCTNVSTSISYAAVNCAVQTCGQFCRSVQRTTCLDALGLDVSQAATADRLLNSSCSQSAA